MKKGRTDVHARLGLARIRYTSSYMEGKYPGVLVFTGARFGSWALERSRCIALHRFLCIHRRMARLHIIHLHLYQLLPGARVCVDFCDFTGYAILCLLFGG